MRTVSDVAQNGSCDGFCKEVLWLLGVSTEGAISKGFMLTAWARAPTCFTYIYAFTSYIMQMDAPGYWAALIPPLELTKLSENGKLFRKLIKSK